jgi:DNA-binding LacI/PurR family transcriptional regulator
MKSILQYNNKIAGFFRIRKHHIVHYIHNFLDPFITGLFEEGNKIKKYIEIIDREELKTFVNKKITPDYDGAITIIDNGEAEYFESWKKLHNTIPCINLLHKDCVPGENFVRYDENAGMIKICKHIYEEGFTSAGFVSDLNQPWALNRYSIFKNYFM